MHLKFHTLGIYGRYRQTQISETLELLVQTLLTLGKHVIIESSTAEKLSLPQSPQLSVQNYENFGSACDLVIVVGGDGSLLQAARAVLPFETPVLGINRGRLGFLTDISPDCMLEEITAIFDGKFTEETRFTLDIHIQQDTQKNIHTLAINDAVLLPGKFAHMIQFDVYVNQELMCGLRADGLIVSTPTGSTAYALSGGGPILHPALEAVVMVPMFPHSLTNRPIVVNADSEICLHITPDNETSPFFSCDGQERITIAPNTKIWIRRGEKKLRLIHPLSYRYFETLRSKLGWQHTAHTVL